MNKLKDILRRKKKEIKKIQNQKSDDEEINLKKREMEQFENKKVKNTIEDNSEKIMIEIIKNFKKEKKIEIEEKKENIIKKWDFEIKEKEIKKLKETNTLLKTKLESCQKYYPKMDYLKKELDYIERSDQLKNFIILSVNKIDHELINTKKDSKEIKIKKEEDLQILEKVKKDIQYLFLYLNEYVI